LDVGGKPLILRTVDMLLKNNIEVTVIVGYKHAHIEQVLRDKQVHIVYNPFFDVTNSIGSLWLAKGYMLEDDTIIANADVFWSQELLDQLLAAAENTDVFMLADRRRAEDGDYFFDIEDGCIRKYGKELKREERNAEYVGIAYVNRQFLPDFVRRMDELVDGQNHNVWWENVLYSFIGEREIKALEVGESFWAEIDFIEDYHRINAYVSNTEEI
jgi:choline kinase